MSDLCRFAPPRALLARRWNRLNARLPADRFGDRGSITAEVIVLTPLLLLMLVFVVYAGRLVQTNSAVHHAADQAARAATLGKVAGSETRARSAAVAELARSGLTCRSQSVSAARSKVGLVETVTVTVSCVVSRSDLAPLAPGSHTVTASSTEVFDVRRAQ